MRLLPPTFAAILAAACALLVAAGVAPRRDGPRFEVGAGHGRDGFPWVAMNEAGRMAVIWRDLGTGTTRLRVYAADGHVAGEADLGDAPEARPALDERGEIAVALTRCTGDRPSTCTAFGRVFDDAAVPKGAEFALDPATAPGQSFPLVARERSGRMIFGWSKDSPSYPYIRNGYIRLADSDGVFLGSPLRLGEPGRWSFSSDAAVDASGEYVVVYSWAKAQRYDPNLNPVGPPISWTSVDESRVARSPDGPFVIGWRRYMAPDEGYEIRVEFRRFDAAGQPVGPQELARSGLGYFYASTAPVAVSNRDDFVIAWTEATPWGFPSSDDAWFRLYDAGRAPVSDAGLIHDADPAGHQRSPDVGMSARGDVTIVYEDQNRIVGQRYCANLFVSAPAPRAACVGGTASFAVQATGRLPLAYTWRRNGVPLVESARVRGTNGPILVLDPVAPGDAGAYDCVISDACPVVASAMSAAAALTLAAGAPLGAVTNVRVAREGVSSLRITWDDVAGATDYVVYEDIFADSGFVTPTGTAASGATGLAVPLPRSERFYRVAARNAACGAGAP